VFCLDSQAKCASFFVTLLLFSFLFHSKGFNWRLAKSVCDSPTWFLFPLPFGLKRDLLLKPSPAPSPLDCPVVQLSALKLSLKPIAADVVEDPKESSISSKSPTSPASSPSTQYPEVNCRYNHFWVGQLDHPECSWAHAEAQRKGI
jgi:hypothetical protein